jgi:hypothetical protein
MTNEKSGNQQGGSGNFANDPAKASEAGRKGGQQSHQGTADSNTNKTQQGGSDSAGGKQRGGSGNFADDPERASEAGRKGGEHSHGNR